MILGEEATERAGRSGVRWIVDPLDGTTNYIYRYPAFGVSIGIELDGALAAGVVQDSARDRLYSASRRRRGGTVSRSACATCGPDDGTHRTGFRRSRKSGGRRRSSRACSAGRDVRSGVGGDRPVRRLRASADAFYEAGLASGIGGGTAIVRAAGGVRASPSARHRRRRSVVCGGRGSARPGQRSRGRAVEAQA